VSKNSIRLASENAIFSYAFSRHLAISSLQHLMPAQLYNSDQLTRAHYLQVITNTIRSKLLVMGKILSYWYIIIRTMSTVRNNTINNTKTFALEICSNLWLQTKLTHLHLYWLIHQQPAVGLHLRNPWLMDYYSFNRPQSDGRLSWPCWLTDGGHFTHKVVTRPAVSLENNRESSAAGRRSNHYYTNYWVLLKNLPHYL